MAEEAPHGVDAVLAAGHRVLGPADLGAEPVGPLPRPVEAFGGLLGLFEEPVDLGVGARRGSCGRPGAALADAPAMATAAQAAAVAAAAVKAVSFVFRSRPVRPLGPGRRWDDT
ncbi:hypothetical protein GCM10020254_59900 [Streptomyces goshikiensis]